MAFEPMYDYFRADVKREVGSQQIGAACKLRALEGEDIDRVLSVVASAVIRGGEALAGEARYNGVATFKAMYVSETGNVQYLCYDADFSGRIEDPSITPKLAPLFDCKVLDTSLSGVSREELNVSAAIEVTLAAVTENEVKYLSGLGEGVYTREDETGYAMVTASKKQSFTVSGETEVKDVLRGVLLAGADSMVDTASTGLDCFVIEGELFATVNYKTDTDECAVKCVSFSVPFKEEMEAAGAMVGQKIAASSCVTGVRLTAEVDEETGKTKIFLEADLELAATSYGEEKLLVVTDVFSPQYELSVDRQPYRAVQLADTVTGSEKVNGSFELTEGNEIDKVLGVCSGSVTVTNCYCKDGRLYVEGVTTCCTLAAHNDKIKSIEIETPFSVALNAGSGAEEGSYSASCALAGVTARHKKTNEIDLTIELEFKVDVFTELSGTVISNVEIRSEKPVPTAAMQVYVPKAGETLWDISKELSVQPDLVMTQNPSLKFPLGGGERILVYRQNKVKF